MAPLVPLLARALFALPPRAQAVLGGRVPDAAAGLEPDAWLVARPLTGAVPSQSPCIVKA